MTQFSLSTVRFQEAVNLITASAVGSTSTTSDAGCVALDLGTKVMVPRFTLQAKVTNNGTAPGTGDTVTVFYAFSSESISDVSATGAPLEFSGNGEASLVVALRNTTNAVHRNTTALLEAKGRYLYVWYDITALAASAAVDVVVDIIWLG